MRYLKPLLFAMLCLTTLSAAAQNSKLLIGTYTNKGNSEGIYIYSFDTETAETKQLNVIKDVNNPSYLALGKDKKTIYSVAEAGAQSSVSAFKFDSNNTPSSFLNREATKGADPCFILVNEKHAITANYSGGSINVFGLTPNGSLTPIKQHIQHTGSGPDQRQASAHVHQVLFSPDKRYLIATDLGEDRIYIYHYNAAKEKPLSFKTSFKTDAGSGPRHLTFSPNGKYAYLAHEFNGKISVFSYRDGNLSLLEAVNTVDNNFAGKIDAADIHVSADGKFLYQSNRGDANTINVFAVKTNGKLKPIEKVSSLGKGPRNFTIDPSGKYLLVAHQYTNNVVIFNRNAKTGKLSDSGKRIEVGMPVCLVIVP